MAQVTAEQLIREFEGYRSTPYWDVNAWRLGYGSDTMTDEQGNVTRVTKNSVTTREAAQRDLERRIPEFQKQGIIPFVGEKAWKRLPTATKAAITSVAYNYGGLENLKSLTAAIKAGDTDAMAKALEGYGTHNGGINKSRRLKEASIVRGAPIPPGMLGDDPQFIRESIQDRNAARLGYGEIAPEPGSGRPAYFNETGKPPIPATRTPAAPRPATMSPALQAARQRLTAAREMRATAAANGETSAAALAVTPRLTSANGEVTGIEDTRPSLDWGQFRPGASVGGVGSLIDGGINPAAPNPSKPPVAGLRLPTSQTTVTGRPDAPVGALPAGATTATTGVKPGTGLKSPASPASGPAAGRPGGATVVPTGGGKIDAGTAERTAPQAVTREQQTAQLPNGKTVTIGQSYIVGDKLMIADLGSDGKAILRDVKDTLPFGASLLMEQSIAGAAARGLVAPQVKQKMAEAGTAAQTAIGNTLKTVNKTVGGLATQARDTIGGMFTPKPTTKAANANLTLAKSEQAIQRGNTLSRPAVPRGNSLSAGVKPLVAPKPTMITVANPAYAEWVKKYGTSPVNPAAVSKLEDIHDRQAAALGYGALPPVPANRPPAPPKMITVSKPANTLSAPVPAPREARPASTIVAIGGYLYDSSQRTATGGLLKVGKVGTSTGSTLTSAPRTSSSGPSSSSSSADRYAASAARSVDRQTGGAGGNPTWW